MNLQGILDNIEEKAVGVENPEDYRDSEGLLVCGKCHTRKQTRVELFGKVRTPYCICKCEAERMDAEEQRRKEWEKLDKITRMRRLGFPDSEMTSWTFANDDQANVHVSTLAKNYVDNFATMREKGKGLLLWGNVGGGKTYAAACIANALIDQGKPCLVTNFARLTNTIGGMYQGKQDYLDSLAYYDLLVIDDLASERDTEFMGEMVFNIIDARYRTGKPLIVTTNLTMGEITNPSDVRRQRVYSRLLEMCIPIEVKGSDRRRKKAVDDGAEMAALLGLG